jgi:predicted acetyltransferase
VAVAAGAYEGILAFLRNQEAVFRNLLVNLPPSDPFPFFLPNPRVKRELRTHHMLRLVSLALALEAAAEPSPTAKAEMILSVEDSICSWNDGDWRLTVEDGRAKVTNMGRRTAPPRAGVELVRGQEADRGQRPPRIAMDVRALVQIISGYARAATLERAGRLVASEPAAVTFLDAVYGRRPSHLIDYF